MYTKYYIDIKMSSAAVFQAFRTMDYSSTGVINKKDLREVLYKFMLPISKQEFNKLWARYVTIVICVVFRFLCKSISALFGT